MDKRERHEELGKIFEARSCFKLVCGAGNEDALEVRRLSTVYTLAGATMLDISANEEVVRAARAGIEAAYALAPLLGRAIRIRPYLNVSIGLKGDPHVRKAVIDKGLCTGCAECRRACRQEAITDDFRVIGARCIGCGSCEKACNFGAVSFIERRADLEKILPGCVKEGAETMELHASVEEDSEVFRDWELLGSVIGDNYLSMCLDRSRLSDKHLVERVRKAYGITGERLIIQADGIPMSGEVDDYNTTLQAVACSDIVQKSGIPVKLLLSGGTNSKTGLLARQCGVKANGVAVGSWGRFIVRDLLRRDDFETDTGALKEAVERAEGLIRSNIEALSG